VHRGTTDEHPVFLSANFQDDRMTRFRPRGLLSILAFLFCSGALAQDWLSYGGSPGGSHHSSLSQINRDNVDTLELAWSYQTGALARHPDRKASASSC
jgi:hypothetical protein